MNKKLSIIISSVWLVIAIILTTWSALSVQYPFTGENVIAYALPISFPLAALILSLLSKGKHRALSIIITILFGFVLLADIAYVGKDVCASISLSNADDTKFTDYFPAYRDLFTSSTENIENYLDAEELEKWEMDIINQYFPETIPEESKYPEYSLHISKFFFTSKQITASWELDEKAFSKELNRISLLKDTDGLNPTVTEENGVKRYSFDYRLIEVSFDTQTNRVTYFYNYDD